MKTIYIHPVYPKTGTSYIQETVLSKVKEIEKLIEYNEERTSQGPYHEYFKSNFYKSNSSGNFYNFYKTRENFYDYIVEKIKISKNNKFIISDPGLLDPFGSPGTSNIYLLKDVIKRISNIEKIEIKFLVTIRSQSELIASYYAYRNHYFHNVSDLSLLLKNSIFLENFKFTNLLDHLNEVFENPKILVLPLELLKQNSSEYFQSIENFFQIKLSNEIHKNTKAVNVNSEIINDKKYFLINSYRENIIYTLLTKIHVYLKKFEIYEKLIMKNNLKNILKNYLQKLNKRSIKTKIYLSSNQIGMIKNYFKSDNNELEKKYGINLKNLEYY